MLNNTDFNNFSQTQNIKYSKRLVVVTISMGCQSLCVYVYVLAPLNCKHKFNFRTLFIIVEVVDALSVTVVAKQLYRLVPTIYSISIDVTNYLL